MHDWFIIFSCLKEQFGVSIDSKLTFYDDITKIFSKQKQPPEVFHK